MKKLLSILLAVTMLFSCVSLTGFAAIDGSAEDHPAFNEYYGWIGETYIESTGTVNAPYAGVYLVTSDSDVLLVNETGHYVDVAANTCEYFFLVKGPNSITVDTPATLNFAGLDGNGLDYLSQVEHGDYLITPDDVFLQNNLSIAPGATVSYEVEIPVAGMYYLSYNYQTAPTNQFFTIETDTGMYGKIKHTILGWNHFGDEQYVRYAYLREGTNTIKITNHGNALAVFYQTRISKTSNYSVGLDWANIYYVIEDTTAEATPTPDISSYPEYVTFEDINLSGDSIIGALDTTVENAPGITPQNTIWISSGFTGVFHINAPKAGIYKAQVIFTKNGDVQVIANDAYYQEMTSTAYAYTDQSDVGGYAYIYLNEGENTVTFLNATGEGGELLNLEFRATQALYDANEEFDMDSLLAYEGEYEIIPISGWNALDKEKSEGTIRQYVTYNCAEVVGGSSAAYTFTAKTAGIYRVTAKIGATMITPYPTIYVDVNETYRASFMTDYADDYAQDENFKVQIRETDADGNYQYVYVPAGTNYLTVSASHSHFLNWSIELRPLSATEKGTVTIDDCKLAPPKPLRISPYHDSILTTDKVDYHITHTQTLKPYLTETTGTELVSGEWQRFEVTAKTPGTYQVSTNMAVYAADTTISVETENSIAYVKMSKNSTAGVNDGNYQTASGGYVTLKEGINSVWVRNDGPGWGYLRSIVLTHVEDTTEIHSSIFVQAHKFIGAAENAKDIPAYTVRNNYYGIHMGSASNTAVNSEEKQYNVTIPKDDYYGLIMTATVPLTAQMTITLSDGVNDDIVFFDDETPYFGNENQPASITLTNEKFFVPAGDYVMTVNFTENENVGSVTTHLTHVHGFQLTTMTRKDLLLSAIQTATTTAEVKAALAEYSEELKADIGADVNNDFIYPEYAYNAILNAAMLESGSYETYEDVLTAYAFAKDLIVASGDGADVAYTVQIGDWNPVGTTAIVAVYVGDQLYTMGEGYLEYDEANPTYSYVPVDVYLYDYVPEPGDVIKVFVWDSYGNLRPVF